MKTVIAAIVALSATTGLSFAQQAPVLIGNVSANVAERYNANTDVNTSRIGRTHSAAVKVKKRGHKRYPRLVTGDPSPFTGR